MRTSAAILTAVLTSWGAAACGQEAYGSVEELRDAVVESTAVGCPVFEEGGSGGSPDRHGTCSDPAASFFEFDLDVFDSNEQRDGFIDAMADYPFPFCVAYGEGWAVTFRGEMAAQPFCQAVADRMDAQLRQGGTP